MAGTRGAGVRRAKLSEREAERKAEHQAKRRFDTEGGRRAIVTKNSQSKLASFQREYFDCASNRLSHPMSWAICIYYGVRSD
ncbi:protein of unknown function [Pararobbsia alpina]